MAKCYLKGTKVCQNCEQYGKCESFKEPLFNLYNNGTKVNIEPMTIKKITAMQIHIERTFKKYGKLSFYNMHKPSFRIIEAKGV